MEYRVLGPLQVFDGGARVLPGGRLPEKALAVLLAHGGRIVLLDELVDAVWEQSPPSTARHQVHKLISGLRRRLPDAIETDGQGYRLRLADATVDADLFAELAGTASIPNLTAALELWRGPALAGIDGPVVRAWRGRAGRAAARGDRGADRPAAGGRAGARCGRGAARAGRRASAAGGAAGPAGHRAARLRPAGRGAVGLRAGPRPARRRVGRRPGGGAGRGIPAGAAHRTATGVHSFEARAAGVRVAGVRAVEVRTDDGRGGRVGSAVHAPLRPAGLLRPERRPGPAARRRPAPW